MHTTAVSELSADHVVSARDEAIAEIADPIVSHVGLSWHDSKLNAVVTGRQQYPSRNVFNRLR